MKLDISKQNPVQVKQVSTVFLHAEMFRILITGRLLQLQVQDVWLPLMLKGGLPLSYFLGIQSFIKFFFNFGEAINSVFNIFKSVSCSWDYFEYYYTLRHNRINNH